MSWAGVAGGCPVSEPTATRGPGRLEPGDLLSVPQALRLLPVSKATMYRLVSRGEVPALRIPTAGGGGGRVLISRQGLEDFVRRMLSEAPKAVPESVDEILARTDRRVTP